MSFKGEFWDYCKKSLLSCKPDCNLSCEPSSKSPYEIDIFNFPGKSPSLGLPLLIGAAPIVAMLLTPGIIALICPEWVL